MGKKSNKPCLKENRAGTMAFSVLFLVHLFLGKEIYEHNGIDRYLTEPFFAAAQLFCMAGLSVFLYFGIERLLLPLLVRIRNNTNINKTECKRKWFPVIWIGILTAWFPAFLAYYPGILSYDAEMQTMIALGIAENSSFHPPLHTFLWKFCIYLGDRINNSALSVYGLLQMILLSLVMAYMLYTIKHRGPGKIFFILSCLFIAVNPVMAIMSLCMTKDVPFCMALTCSAIELLKMEEDPADYFRSGWNVLRFIVFSTLAGLLRNNMIYAFILAFVLIIVTKGIDRKRFIPIAAAVVCCIIIVNGPAYSAMGINPGNPREALSVPIQQISRAVSNHKEMISDEEKEEIELYLPFDSLEWLYNPRFADPVKEQFLSYNYVPDKGRFIILWLNLMKRFPIDYINAFLELNIPYWYIGADTIDPYSQRIYIETNICEIACFPVCQTRKTTNLLEYYESFASFSALKNKSFLLRLPFSISVPIWLILFGVMILLRLNKGRYLAVYAVFFFLWLTYMAGPVSNFRYIFPIYAVYPFLLHLMLSTDAAKAEKRVVFP